MAPQPRFPGDIGPEELHRINQIVEKLVSEEGYSEEQAYEIAIERVEAEDIGEGFELEDDELVIDETNPISTEDL